MSLGVSYKFSAVDGVSRIVDKIARKTGKLDDKIVEIGTKSARSASIMRRSFGKMNRSASMLSGKLRGLAIAGAGFFGAKEILKKGMEFEDAIAGVAAITGATGKDLKFFTDESIRMSKKFGTSAASVAASFLDIGSAKSELLKSPGKLSTIVEQTALLSKGGGVNMAIATEAMTKSLNIFRKGADSAESFSDIMIQGTVVGAAKLDEFAQSILNAGGGAVSAGLSFKDTTALIQLMSKGGEVGARAGTALNSFFAKMSKDFKNVDISTGDKLLVFLNKLDTAVEGGFNISAKFGEEAARAVRIMLAQKDFLKPFTLDIGAAKGATAKAAEIRMATTSNKLARLRARLDVGMLKVFAKLEPTLSTMTEDFIKWIDNIKTADIESFFTVLSDIANVFKAIGKTINLIIKGWKEIFGLIGEFREGEKQKLLVKAKRTIDYSLPQNRITQLGLGSALGGDLSSELPPGQEKTTVDININAPDGVVQSVKQRTESLTGGGKRKSKVRTNMSGV